MDSNQTPYTERNLPEIRNQTHRKRIHRTPSKICRKSEIKQDNQQTPNKTTIAPIPNLLCPEISFSELTRQTDIIEGDINVRPYSKYYLLVTRGIRKPLYISIRLLANQFAKIGSVVSSTSSDYLFISNNSS